MILKSRNSSAQLDLHSEQLQFEDDPLSKCISGGRSRTSRKTLSQFILGEFPLQPENNLSPNVSN